MGWENVGGRETYYGALTQDNVFGGEIASAGKKKELKFVFDYTDLPAVDAGNAMLANLPAGALITEAHVKVLTAISGTTPTLTIGTSQADGGGVIDADGIDAAISAAALGTGLTVSCDGAQIGGVAMAEEASIVVATGGTVTAGRFELSIEYIV